jgi:hypothetical protein
MSVHPVTGHEEGLSAVGSRLSAGEEGRDGFAGMLKEAREAAAQLVSTAFIVPVLESLRESPFPAGPFAPNFTERRFAPLLDEKIADRVVTSANFRLVDSIVERLLHPGDLARLRQELIDATG